MNTKQNLRLIVLQLFVILIFTVNANSTETPLKLNSPNGELVFSFQINEENPTYSIVFKGHELINNSTINLTFKETGLFGKNLNIQNHKFREIDESYELIVGKNKMVRNRCNELVVGLQEQNKPFRKINLVVRAFDEGVAIRYDFPKQKHWKSFSMTDEKTSFNVVGDPQVLTLFRSDFLTSHEGLYSQLPYSKIQNDTLMDMPALLDFEGIYMAITEASLVDYAGMYLIKENGILSSELSPLPEQENVRVKTDLPHKSPWRVMMISDRIGDLFESNILTSLCEPNKIEDVSWIKPGIATWPWWNGTIVSDSTIVPGNNFETNKYYIDFCARHGFEYHSVVEHGNHEWYVNNNMGYMPGTGVDVTKAVKGLDMQQVCDYAKSQSVGIRVWVHWEALYPKLEEAFSQYEKWGIQGLMVDFMDRDDQEMVNIQNEILERAAAHRLHIQFHGAYKPTGLNRTYPNEFTREGALNYEVNKWDTTITPDHDLNIIYARLLAGATDYHMGGFRAVPEKDFTVNFEKPLMMGTRCHMLGMYVVLESYLGLVCDFPEAYEGQPGFDFIKNVPTVWDETKVLNGEISEYITMARRKGEEWFVGTVNNSSLREIELTFDFLPPGEYKAEIYTDSPSVEKDPNQLVKQVKLITSKDKINILLASGGGGAIYIRPSSSKDN